MKSALEYILKNIADKPKDIKIEEKTGDNRTLFIVHAHQDDMGKIIGKQGRIIRAIRDLIKLIAAKNNIYADVSLSEEE